MKFQAEVEFDYSMGDGKQMLSAKLTDLQMHASQFPDVTKTTYKVSDKFVARMLKMRPL